MKPRNLQDFFTLKHCQLLRIISVLIIYFLPAIGSAQSLIPELIFRNPKLKTGKGCSAEGRDGAVYIFSDVGYGIDAIVTILGRSQSQVLLSDVDLPGPEQDFVNGTGLDNAWQPRIAFADGRAPAYESWWMEFNISFVKHTNQNEPVSVNQFFVSGLDIDGDGIQLHEYQAYYKMHSFTLVHETAIYASSFLGSESDPLLKGKRFDGPTNDYPGIMVSAEDAIVNNFYTRTPSLIVRLGAETGFTGSVKANRMYGLLFKSMACDIPVNNKIPLNWVSSNKGKSPD